MLVRQQHFAGLLKLAQRLPQLRIMIDHIGHMPIDGPAITAEWPAAYHRLAAQPNIFMKVSAVMEQSIIQPAPSEIDFYRPALDALWDAFREDRPIYGSNRPILKRAGSLADSLTIVKTDFAEKGETAGQKYFCDNAKAVYKWPD